MHIWPEDDLFEDYVSQPVGLNLWPSGYITADSWNAWLMNGGAWFVANYQQFPIAHLNQLTNGFSPSAESLLASVAPLNNYWTARGWYGGDLNSFMYRGDLTAGDMATEIGVYALRQLGTWGGANDHIHQCWVGARCSGNAYILSGSTEWLATLRDGYVFGSTSDASGARFWLFKVQAGVKTILFARYFQDTPGGNYSLEADPHAPHYYRIELTTSGPNTVVTCKIGSPGGLATILPKTIFTYTDTSPITTPGRGFFAIPSQQRNNISAPTVVWSVVCPYFRVENPPGTPIVDDQWERRQPRDALGVVLSYPTPKVGYDLRSAWGGDSKANISGSLPWLERATLTGILPAGRAMHDPGTYPLGNYSDYSGGFCLSQRLATNTYKSHRHLRVQFSNDNRGGGVGSAPSTRRYVGITLRESKAVTQGAKPKAGYTCQISTDDGGVFASGRCELIRWVNDGGEVSGTLIAEVDGLTIAAGGTDHDFSFEVFNIQDSGGNPNGIIVCQAWLNAVQIPLVLTTAGSAAGLTGLAAGSILDTTSFGTYSGQGEGFRVMGTTGTRVTYIDEWTALTPSGGPPTGPSENDQVTIVVEGEPSPSSGLTFDTPYDWGVQQLSVAYHSETYLETGYVQRHKRLQLRRQWQISGIVTNAEKSALETFWDNVNGAEKSFTFSPLADDTVTSVDAHFVEESMNFNLLSPGVWSFEVTVEELIPS